MGCSLHSHVLSACVSWRLPACARAADLGWSLARESRGGWGVGMDAAALTRDCPKTHPFNPDYAHHFSLPLSLTHSLYFPPLTPPSSLLSRPRIHSLPLSCCSFSCSCLTPPSQPHAAYPKTNAPQWLVCCHGDHSLLSLLFIRAIDLF